MEKEREREGARGDESREAKVKRNARGKRRGEGIVNQYERQV